MVQIELGHTWAHPRVCGENHAWMGPRPRAWGSSPRVRGKRIDTTLQTRADGLIPACAGKTTCDTNKLFFARAHPRVCGENRLSSSKLGGGAGSSPRVRGKRGGWR